MMCSVYLPIRTVSETNQREHWAARHRRRKAQRVVVRARLLAAAGLVATARWHRAVDGGVVVRLTRVAPRALDDDNLRGATKACRDGVADWLGVNDSDERVCWVYEQHRGSVGEYAVEIEVEEVEK